jgi:hypothetical protein
LRCVGCPFNTSAGFEREPDEIDPLFEGNVNDLHFFVLSLSQLGGVT